MNQYTVTELIPIAEFAAEGINVAHGLANKKGVFTLFNLGDEAMALGRVDWDLASKQAGELNEEEQRQVVAAFAVKLRLDGEAGKKLEQKIEDGALQAVDLIAYAKQSYEWGKAWWEKTQSLFA